MDPPATGEALAEWAAFDGQMGRWGPRLWPSLERLCCSRAVDPPESVGKEKEPQGSFLLCLCGQGHFLYRLSLVSPVYYSQRISPTCQLGRDSAEDLNGHNRARGRSRGTGGKMRSKWALSWHLPRLSVGAHVRGVIGL